MAKNSGLGKKPRFANWVQVPRPANWLIFQARHYPLEIRFLVDVGPNTRRQRDLLRSRKLAGTTPLPKPQGPGRNHVPGTLPSGPRDLPPEAPVPLRARALLSVCEEASPPRGVGGVAYGARSCVRSGRAHGSRRPARATAGKAGAVWPARSPRTAPCMPPQRHTHKQTATQKSGPCHGPPRRLRKAVLSPAPRAAPPAHPRAAAAAPARCGTGAETHRLFPSWETK